MDIKTIISTAVITTIIGLTGNYFYSDIVSNEEISILPSSFGFYSPDSELINVSDELLELTKGSHFARVNEKESYSKLEKVRADSIVQIKDMEKTISLCEDWLKNNSVDIEKGQEDINHQLKRSAVLSHPIFEPTQEFLGMIILKLRRGELETPRKPLEEMAHLKNVIPVKHYVDKSKWEISGSLVRVPIPYGTFPPEYVNLARNMVRTLSRGVGDNLAFFTRQYIEYASSFILQTQKIKEKIEGVLVNKAYLHTKVIIENSGNTSVTVKPFYFLQLSNGDFNYEVYMRSITVKINNGEEVGKELHQNFLPKANSNPYINVSPGNSVEVNLISTKPLGEQGSVINNLYETELLNMKLSSITTSGKTHTSHLIPFSKSIYKDDQIKLKNVE